MGFCFATNAENTTNFSESNSKQSAYSSIFNLIVSTFFVNGYQNNQTNLYSTTETVNNQTINDIFQTDIQTTSNQTDIYSTTSVNFYYESSTEQSNINSQNSMNDSNWNLLTENVESKTTDNVDKLEEATQKLSSWVSKYSTTEINFNFESTNNESHVDMQGNNNVTAQYSTSEIIELQSTHNANSVTTNINGFGSQENKEQNTLVFFGFSTTTDRTTDPSNEPQVYNCTKEGKFPSTVSCNEYYFCKQDGTKLVYIKETCWRGFEFNSVIGYCVPSFASNCKIQNNSDGQEENKETTISSQTIHHTNTLILTNSTTESIKNFSSNTELQTDIQQIQNATVGIFNYTTSTTKTTEIPSDDSFHCIKSGKFASLSNCRNYYICKDVGGILLQINGSCWNGFEFHSKLHKCVPRFMSDCKINNENHSNDTRIFPDEDTSFNCTQSGKFPSTSNCKDFHICKQVHNSILHFSGSCWNDFEFHSKLHKCVPRFMSDCKGNKTEESTNSANERNNSTNSFHCKRPGIFPATSNCRDFHLCKKIKHQLLDIELSCHDDFEFHSKLRICVPSLLSDCTIQKSDGVYNTSNINCIHINFAEDSSAESEELSKHQANNQGNQAFQCKSSGLFPSTSGCGNYHLCKNTTDSMIHIEKKCPRDFEFNSELRSCVPKYLSNCNLENNSKDFKDSVSNSEISDAKSEDSDSDNCDSNEDITSIHSMSSASVDTHSHNKRNENSDESRSSDSASDDSSNSDEDNNVSSLVIANSKPSDT